MAPKLTAEGSEQCGFSRSSYLVGLLWQAILNFALPSYLAGLIGGLVALPVWDLLKRVRPSQA
jgi:hypothetical protein